MEAQFILAGLQLLAIEERCIDTAILIACYGLEERRPPIERPQFDLQALCRPAEGRIQNMRRQTPHARLQGLRAGRLDGIPGMRKLPIFRHPGFRLAKAGTQ